MKLFLSYASEDRERVLRLYENLKAAGFDPWIDVRDIPKGEDWDQAIETAIRRSEVFIACISRASVVKTGVLEKEIDQALAARKARSKHRLLLVPVRLDNTPAPRRLSHIQWIDLDQDEKWRDIAQVVRKEEARLLRRRFIAAGLAIVALAGAGYGAWRLRPSGRPATPAVVAVDVLRLRHRRPNDPPENVFRMSPTPDNGLTEPTDMVAEQIGVGEELSITDLVLLRLVSSQPGFVQVVDQELVPEPARPIPLIRDQRIEAGRSVEIPRSAPDTKSYLRFESANPHYAGEQLTIIVTPQPLSPRLTPAPAPELDPATWKDWQARFPGIPAKPGQLLRTSLLPADALGPGAKELRIESASAVYSSPSGQPGQGTAARLTLRVRRVP